MSQILGTHLQDLTPNERPAREHAAVVAAQYSVESPYDAFRAKESQAVHTLFLKSKNNRTGLRNNKNHRAELDSLHMFMIVLYTSGFAN